MSSRAGHSHRTTRSRWDCVRWSGALPVMLAGLVGISMWKTSVEAFASDSRREADRAGISGAAPDGRPDGRPTAEERSSCRDDASEAAPAERSDDDDHDGSPSSHLAGGEAANDSDSENDESSLPRDGPAAAALGAPPSLDGRVAGSGRTAAAASLLAATPPDFSHRTLAGKGALSVSRLLRPPRRPGALRPAPRGPPARS